MFLTESGSETALFPWMQLDLRAWVRVEFASHAAALWIEAVEHGTRGARQRVFLTETCGLERFLAAPEIELGRVAVLSPGHVNGSSCWSLDDVTEVWRCVTTVASSFYDAPGWLYVLTDGRELVSCAGSNHPSAVRRVHKLYAGAAVIDRSKSASKLRGPQDLKGG